MRQTIMNLKRSICIFAMMSALGVSANAAEKVNPSSYIVTVKRTEICTAASGGECVTLGSGVQQFDIASASVGATVGNYITNFTLPEDKIFTHIKTTISRSFSITAIATTQQDGAADDLCSTTGAGVVTASSTSQAASQVTANGTASAQTFVVPDTTAANVTQATQEALYSAQGIELINSDEMIFTKALSTPVDTSQPSPPPSIDISFGTANTLEFNTASATDCFAYLSGAPSMTISFQ